jgi:DUF4097 and DUF4098 domain-containing protein YvlB
VDADEIARAAAELAQRAEELSKRAREAGEVDEELVKLEAELAALDAERDRLDADIDRAVVDDLERPASNGNGNGQAPRDGDVEDGWTFRLGNLGERIADLVGAAINLGGAVRTAGYHRDVVERELSCDGIRPVSVHSFAGSINVVAGDDGVVSVKATKQALDAAGLEAIDITVEDTPGGIEVRAATEGWSIKSWVQLDVRVPESTPLRLRTQAGSVRVDGVGADVDCHTNGGSIRVSGSCGAAVLETAGGGIKLDDHEGPVTAHTMGGSIKLAGDLGPAVEAETIGGSIRIDGVDGSVAATTKGGSVHVNGRFAGSCSVETAGGSVSIGLETGTRVTVEGSGSSASTDVPGLEARGGRITGDVDGGGDGHLVARTIAGAIRIRRA